MSTLIRQLRIFEFLIDRIHRVRLRRSAVIPELKLIKDFPTKLAVVPAACIAVVPAACKPHSHSGLFPGTVSTLEGKYHGSPFLFSILSNT